MTHLIEPSRRQTARARRPKAAGRSLAFEKIVFSASILCSALTLIVVGRRACLGGDPHSLNRAGAAVVILQVLAAAAEFSRRRRLDELRHETVRSILSAARRDGGTALELQVEHYAHVEIGRAERNALFVVLALAAAGELFHGFGDLFIEHFCR
jgi:hypothetical protein